MYCLENENSKRTKIITDDSKYLESPYPKTAPIMANSMLQYA